MRGATFLIVLVAFLRCLWMERGWEQVEGYIQKMEEGLHPSRHRLIPQQSEKPRAQSWEIEEPTEDHFPCSAVPLQLVSCGAEQGLKPAKASQEWRCNEGAFSR